jgi:putative SbcD/Mre11-related phosphoesterase
MIKFLTDFPALLISEKKMLVIADIHLGLEHELFLSGVTIPSQIQKFQKVIEGLIRMTRAKSLMILGDIKHEVPGISKKEEREIPQFFYNLMEKVEVSCCRGNHDTYLEQILPDDVKIFPSEGVRMGRYGFFHGHAWPSKELMGCDFLITGHIHPVVEFVDKLGYRAVEQVWIRGVLDAKTVKKKFGLEKVGRLDTIIMPAFNRLLGGLAMNYMVDKELMGPLLTKRFFDVNKSDAYMLDGTCLGSIAALKRMRIRHLE